ncbi:hypothetical protein CBS101457_004900 [Exobasidium rhododendri]|nr:hypothetical protein CBS101457_004900 [Exobasidium rhododendri]
MLETPDMLAVAGMPVLALNVPQRTTSKRRPRREPLPRLPLQQEPAKLRPLPVGWVRQYDIIHKRYFYIDIRVKGAPVSTWRFPPGAPKSRALASQADDSADIHKYFPPASAPPPLARKAADFNTTSASTICDDRAGESSRIIAITCPIVAAGPEEQQQQQQQHAMKKDTPPTGNAQRKPSFPDFPTQFDTYSSDFMPSDLPRQRFGLDYDSSEAADILLTLAFPLIVDPSDSFNESPERRGSSDSSSGSSFSDADSNWLTDL